MKKKILSLLILTSFLVTGCINTKPSSDPSSQVPSSGEQSSSSSEEQSSSSSIPDRPTTGTTTIDIFSTNDFHGAVEEIDEEVGLARWGTYLKNANGAENTLVIDQGDTYQGSIYSNFNRGALLTDVMNYVQFDAHTIGNHDFDWGQEYITLNKNRSYEGYSTPFLAGNVYDYDFDTKTEGTTQRSELGGKSAVLYLENGVKVGILGGIGRNQLEDICSSFTLDICFKNQVNFIKEEATHLRNDLHCDVVIASIHAAQGDMTGNGLNSYVDLVLCGHSHQQETTNEGKLHYIQTLSKGQSIGKTTLTFDYATNKVIDTSINFISSSEIKAATNNIDSTVQGLITQYNNQSKTEREEVLANNVSGYFSKSGPGANLMATAIYDAARASGYDIKLSLINSARENIVNETTPEVWTYTEIYRAFPFDNMIYIADVKGSELLNQLKYDYIYRNPSFTENAIDANGTYRIAVLDFIYLHINNYHIHDYFPLTGGTSTTLLTKNYREILRDYLKANGYNTGKALAYSNFANSLWQHNKNNFYEA